MYTKSCAREVGTTLLDEAQRRYQAFNGKATSGTCRSFPGVLTNCRHGSLLVIDFSCEPLVSFRICDRIATSREPCPKPPPEDRRSSKRWFWTSNFSGRPTTGAGWLRGWDFYSGLKTRLGILRPANSFPSLNSKQRWFPAVKAVPLSSRVWRSPRLTKIRLSRKGSRQYSSKKHPHC